MKKLNSSTILFIGISFICIGVFLACLNYFESKKDKAFSSMNILLYESEIPKEIESDEPVQTSDSTSDISEEPVTQEPERPTYTYNYIGVIEIPKIGVKRGFLDLSSKYNNVDYNVTLINGSTFPDTENNNLILAAHSGNCSYCYFNNLYKLSNNDVAIINYKDYKYTYTLVDVYEVQKTGTVTIYRDYSKNTLTLITCTKNSDTLQSVYIFELIKKEKN